jgi:hypothetical protein
MATRQACNTTTLHDDDGRVIDSSNSITSADIYRWSDVNVGSECNEIIGAADRRKSVRETIVLGCCRQTWSLLSCVYAAHVPNVELHSP